VVSVHCSDRRSRGLSRPGLLHPREMNSLQLAHPSLSLCALPTLFPTTNNHSTILHLQVYTIMIGPLLRSSMFRHRCNYWQPPLSFHQIRSVLMCNPHPRAAMESLQKRNLFEHFTLRQIEDLKEIDRSDRRSLLEQPLSNVSLPSSAVLPVYMRSLAAAANLCHARIRTLL
jgi:hypothetical protein